MNKSLRTKLLQILFCVAILFQMPVSIYASTILGNPEGRNPIPPEAREVDVSKPDHIIGTGTPESCTAEAFIEAVAKGGIIVFNGGPKPFTITLDEPAKIFNNAKPDVVIDGGGLVTLSGGGKTRILYMNTCDPKQVWTTDHAQNQDHPRLTVQNITFANGNSTGDTEHDGGGAIYVRGGRFKVINCRFINNVCAGKGPDVGGGAIRVFDQYEDLPVYVVNSTFGGAEGLGNVGSNGGAISSIGVSWTIINSLFSYNKAIGNGGNPAKPGTPGGGSGGAIYNDGNKMTLSLQGTRIEHNEVNAYGSGIFFVTNDHSGDIILDNSVVENNVGGSWYPKIPGISMHSDTKGTITNSKTTETLRTYASPTYSGIFVDDGEVKLEAYNINGNNYFKLRDIAMMLNATKKQFEITWDENTKTIEMTSGKNYTATGGEFSLSKIPRQRECSLVEPNIVLNGEQIKLTAYNINNYNYFKLRDIAQVIDFGVLWDGKVNKISIDTNIGYGD